MAVATWRDGTKRQWVGASPTARSAIQVGALVVAVLGAYNYSLITLFDNVGLETPLAYVSLVPLFAALLAIARRRPARSEPPIFDRQLDYIVGMPLVLAALFANIALPRQLSVMYWFWRVDLVSLPFFVAGAVALLFGIRALWRQKLAIAFLILAWPWPYSRGLMLSLLNAFTDLTVRVLAFAAGRFHLATQLPGGNDLFEVVHHGRSFSLSVVSACSGVNSVVGFVLVGIAFAAAVHGPVGRKVLWLLGGMMVIWAMNVVRLVVLFAAGKSFGEHVAVTILHPYVGLGTFGLGVGLMIALVRPLGMRVGVAPVRAAPTVAPQGPARLAVPSIAAALMVMAVTATALGVVDANLSVYNLVANSAGEPTLISFDYGPGVAPPGFERHYLTDFTWATPYFGNGSTWDRFVFDDTLTRSAARKPQEALLASSEPVFEDVIDTTDLNSFSAYGIEDCYQFHGYSLRDVSEVTLGGGITGQAMAFDTQQNGAWSIVYWIVPVEGGGAVHYERVVLFLQDSPSSVVRAPAKVAGVRNLSGSLSPIGAPSPVLVENRNFLVAFARELVARQSSMTGVKGT